MFSSIGGLCPLDGSSTPTSTPVLALPQMSGESWTFVSYLTWNFITLIHWSIALFLCISLLISENMIFWNISNNKQYNMHTYMSRELQLPGRHRVKSLSKWVSINDLPETNFKVVISRKNYLGGQWWCTSSIPVPRRQKQVDLCEFKVNLIYRVSSRTVKAVLLKQFKMKKKCISCLDFFYVIFIPL